MQSDGGKGSSDDNVRVAVRCRPLSSKEITEGNCAVVQVDQLRGQITVHLPNPGRSRERNRSFTFDSVFGFEAKQMDIYNETARPIVDFVLEGYNGTRSAETACMHINLSTTYDRYNFCLWSDGYWEDVHYGRGDG